MAATTPVVAVYATVTGSPDARAASTTATVASSPERTPTTTS